MLFSIANYAVTVDVYLVSWLW